MKTGKELKPGTVIRLENDPWLVQKAEFTKSGRNSAIMKTKLKNLLTGYKTEIVYSADDKLDDVILDRLFEQYQENLRKQEQQQTLDQARSNARNLSNPKCQFWLQQDQNAPNEKTRANVLQFCD